MDKADAFELLPSIDPDVRRQFLDGETANSVTDVVRALARSRTPIWLSYYIQEHDPNANVGAALRELLDDAVINEEAAKYADAESGIIDLRGPGEQNWMSDDPMRPARERFEAKQGAVASALVDAYAAVFHEVQWFDGEAFQTWLHEQFVDGVPYVAWAVYEHRAKELGTGTPTEQAAQWCVERTRIYDLERTIRTFEHREDNEETYVNANYMDALPSDNPVHVRLTESDNPVRSPPLPRRDIDIREHVDDDAFPT